MEPKQRVMRDRCLAQQLNYFLGHCYPHRLPGLCSSSFFCDPAYMHPGKQQILPPVRETQMEFLASGISLAHPWLFGD